MGGRNGRKLGAAHSFYKQQQQKNSPRAKTAWIASFLDGLETHH